MYKINIKRLDKTTFSSIMVWLTPKQVNVDSDFIHITEDMQLKVFGYICYNHQLISNLDKCDGDITRCLDMMYDDFKTEFDDSIQHILSVVDDKVLSTMLNTIKLFIYERLTTNKHHV
jgi:hypothetical protein